MKKLVITEVKSYIDDRPEPYVRHYDYGPIPELVPHDGSAPAKDYIEFEMIHAVTFITSEGKELNICMSREAREILGLPMDTIHNLLAKLEKYQNQNLSLSLKLDLHERAIKRLKGMKWYHRLWAVFVGLEVRP